MTHSDLKSDTQLEIFDEAIDQHVHGDVIDTAGGTADDRANMLRMGKPQELKVHCGFLYIPDEFRPGIC